YKGQATWYTQDGNAGSCGNYNSDSAMIVAVTESMMKSSLCGKKVTIKNTANGNTQTATIADTCPGCESQSLDLSTGLFSALADADMDLGVLKIEWSIDS
ncbi:barwin-like endoglucanase, partial [Microstroma glucosiphilum]